MTGTSPRLPSASTSRPARARVRADGSSASQPAKPSRSKHASWGLAATHAGPAASISAREWASTAAAASAGGGAGAAGRSGGDGGAAERGGEAPRGSPVASTRGPPQARRDRGRSRGRSATRAPRPRRRAVRRSAGAGPLTAGARHGRRCQLLDGLLEARAGGEARHLAGRDRHRLARAGVATLAGAALGDVELPEAGEADLLATLQRLSIVGMTASTACRRPSCSGRSSPRPCRRTPTSSCAPPLRAGSFPRGVVDCAKLTAVSDGNGPWADSRKLRTAFSVGIDVGRRWAAEIRASAASGGLRDGVVGGERARSPLASRTITRGARRRGGAPAALTAPAGQGARGRLTRRPRPPARSSRTIRRS